MSESNPPSVRRAASIVRSLKGAVLPARLLLVAKTALAVGLAWMIAPHLPGVTDDYPYYAPLGALVSMYPTLMSSLRSSLQTVLGLVTGIGLAALVVVAVGPSWWSIPIVVGLGVLVSGTGWFGSGQEYIPIAALFVLIIGGQNADAYSLGYLTQMGLGVAIGLAVNILIAPAPLTDHATARVDAFQQHLAAHLRDIGNAVSESWPPAHDGWVHDAESLAETARSVQRALWEADDSRRGNFRAWFGPSDSSEAHERLDTLDKITHHIRDISDCLADTIWERPGGLTLDPALVGPLASACHAVADVIGQPQPLSPEAHRARGDAARSVRLLLETVDRRTFDVRRVMGPGVLTAMHLRRILMLTVREPA
ncbi:FUSC family protein [Microbacterium sp. A93]|uniref:FUSC family protein n=1 Tax=Microbacterium sp. A93 TaxID=3450716 RepID=UPI003F43B9E9